MGFEPTTRGLKVPCSTAELTAHRFVPSLSVPPARPRTARRAASRCIRSFCWCQAAYQLLSTASPRRCRSVLCYRPCFPCHADGRSSVLLVAQCGDRVRAAQRAWRERPQRQCRSRLPLPCAIPTVPTLITAGSSSSASSASVPSQALASPTRPPKRPTRTALSPPPRSNNASDQVRANNPAIVTATSRRTAVFDCRLLAAERAWMR